MACYKCGGEGGDEAKLCAKCTQERLQGYKQQAAQQAPRGKELPNMDSPWERLEFLIEQPVVKLIMGITVALIALYYILFSRLGPGIGYSASERIYFRCMEKVSKQKPLSTANLGTNKSPGAREIEKAIASMTADAAKGMGHAVCKLAKEACEKDKNVCGVTF